MALQVRRGTNAERLNITPLAGELIYVTDTKQLYIGDGSTAGGTTSIAGTIDSLLADTSPQLGGELDLNGNNVSGTGNVNITGNVTATAFTGDGSALTNIPSSGLLNIAEDTTPQLGGNLDLNNNNITGTGSINITGTISASGNINLGDGVGGDILVIGGSIQGNLVPDSDVTWDLGSASNHFKEGWISQLTVENQLTATRIMGDLIADDSTVVFDSSTGLVAAQQLTGNATINVVGSLDGVVGGTTPAAGSFTNLEADIITGDLTGSVYGDDSTLMIDGLDGSIHAASFKPSGDVLVKKSSAGAFAYQIEGNNNTTTLALVTNKSAGTLAGTGYSSKLTFGFNDAGGSGTTGLILGGEEAIYMISNSDGSFAAEANFLTYTETGRLGIGTYTPTEKLDIRGNIKATGGYIGGVQAISGAGAIDVTTLHTEITTTGADAYTLANGVAGQLKIISMKVDGGDGTLTPTTLATGTTITFDDVNESVTMIYSSLGWLPISVQGATVA
jgi:hypothetical protein